MVTLPCQEVVSLRGEIRDFPRERRSRAVPVEYPHRTITMCYCDRCLLLTPAILLMEPNPHITFCKVVGVIELVVIHAVHVAVVVQVEKAMRMAKPYPQH